MADIVDGILMQLADRFPEQFNDPLVLATPYGLDVAMAWLHAVYPGDGEMPYASIPLVVGHALLFFLDGRRITADELITKLNGLGIACEHRKLGPWPGVYIPLQEVAAARAAQWN